MHRAALAYYSTSRSRPGIPILFLGANVVRNAIRGDRWLRHPMYVGVLLGVWATPRMSFGHLLLALALTAYVMIAMRYEERDLLHRFGRRYADWRGVR